jgi:uncharacterized protein
MAEQLAVFKYHPDPVLTGSLERSNDECPACGSARGYRYVGPVYADDEAEGLCPWCIANGSAADKFDAEFTDVGWGVPGDVKDAAIEELAKRTPGFSGLQQEHWLYHCGDAAAFLGPAGFDELEGTPDALEMLLHEHDSDGWDLQESEDYVRRLASDGDATAYLFKCLRCERHLAYSDTA